MKKLLVALLLFFSVTTANAQAVKASFGVKAAGFGTLPQTEIAPVSGLQMGGGGGAFFGKVGSFEEGYEFDAVILDDSILPHPQSLNLAERVERAVYLGLDEKKITAKFVAGRKII
jgi:hypothetical protein